MYGQKRPLLREQPHRVATEDFPEKQNVSNSFESWHFTLGSHKRPQLIERQCGPMPMNHSMTVSAQHCYVRDFSQNFFRPFRIGSLGERVQMVNLSEFASDLSVNANEVKTANLTRTSINLFSATGKGSDCAGKRNAPQKVVSLPCVQIRQGWTTLRRIALVLIGGKKKQCRLPL